jgi:Cu/Ag efflux pump CusA
VGNFFQDQAVFDVVVWGTPSARANLPAVRNLLISTSGRGYVRLGKIARVTVHADPVDIQHQALSRYVDVTAAVPAGDMASVDRAVTQVLHQVKFPLQYHAEVLGSTPDDPTSHFAFLSYLAAAALGVLLLLQAALRSWRVAALLFLVVPVSLSGGLIVALALGQASSIGAYAGLLAVFVFAARHAMLQIERIRRTQMREAAPLNSSLIVRAASSRLAEFTSSAVVIAAVMLPFAAMGDVGGNELTRTAAAVVLGGLLSTLVLNLLLLPALYLAIRPPSAPALGDPLEELAHELTVSAPTRT